MSEAVIADPSGGPPVTRLVPAAESTAKIIETKQSTHSVGGHPALPAVEQQPPAMESSPRSQEEHPAVAGQGKGGAGAQFYNSSLAKQGDMGSALRPRPTGTVWKAGEGVEVAWNILANHVISPRKHNPVPPRTLPSRPSPPLPRCLPRRLHRRCCPLASPHPRWSRRSAAAARAIAPP